MERRESLGEEIANAVTHGIGALVAAAGLVVMVVVAARRGSAWQVAACSIYGASLVLLYLNSTLYHALAHNRAKHVFKILDHASIYVLIAGTYTPFTLVTLGGGWGWALFGIVWGLAIVGVVFKSIWIGRLKILSTAVYVAMGWLAIVAVKPLLAALPVSGFLWLLAGGLCYTGGVAFYASRWRYAHFLWHLWVMAGSACHYWAVYRYVLTPR
jgi:hemolysin III